MAAQSPVRWYTINKRLLPIKGVYCLFFGGTGGLFPFITIYMKQLGLSSTETGIIYGLMPFISFLVQPLFGALADKTKKHKLVLTICVLLTGLFYGLLLITPPREHDGPSKLDFPPIVIQCGQNGSSIRDCGPIQNSVVGIERQFQDCDIILHHISNLNNTLDDHVNCEVMCKLRNPKPSVSAQVCFIQDFGFSNNNSCVVYLNHSQIINHDLKFKINKLEGIPDNQMNEESGKGDGQNCHDYNLKDISYYDQNFSNLLCTSNVMFECLVNFRLDHHATSCFNTTSLDKTFWIFLIIFLFANIFFSPVYGLINAISYDILGEKRGEWGRQRNWGTIGYTIFAVASTSIMDALSKRKHQIDFSISFYIFVGLCVATSVVLYFLQILDTFQCKKISKNIRGLLKYSDVVIFLIIITFFGVFNSVIDAFLFWFLKDLGSSQITLGFCIVLNCIPESITLFYAGDIMKKIGEVHCLYLGIAAFAVRFFAYSFLTNVWYVLPVEVLHCLTSGLFFAAATAYGSKLTPPGISGTVQGLITGLYCGFGKGVGSLVTGKLIEPTTGLGARWTFRFYGFLATFLLVTYSTVQTVYLRKKSESPTKASTFKDGEAEEVVDDILLGDKTVGN